MRDWKFYIKTKTKTKQEKEKSSHHKYFLAAQPEGLQNILPEIFL